VVEVATGSWPGGTAGGGSLGHSLKTAIFFQGENTMVRDLISSGHFRREDPNMIIYIVRNKNKNVCTPIFVNLHPPLIHSTSFLTSRLQVTEASVDVSNKNRGEAELNFLLRRERWGEVTFVPNCSVAMLITNKSLGTFRKSLGERV
jgi:hypothetical protein